MKRTIVFLLLIALTGGIVPSRAAAESRLSDEELRNSVERAVDWLLNAQEPSGHFKYEYLPYEGTYRKDDNIVRQAGALFALGEVERFDKGARYDLKDEMIRSADYFGSLSISGTYGGREFRCIKELTASSCKLGATALAAVALMDLLNEYPNAGKQYEKLLDEYVSYILVMKKGGEGFRYYYNPRVKKQRSDESSFSNGEAFFALVRYFERTKDKEAKQIIDETFTYLNDPQKFDSALYLWAMAGMRDLIRLEPKETYRAYVREYTAWRLRDNEQYVRSTHNRCPYIEGLAYAASMQGPLKEAEGGPTVKMIDTLNSMLAHTTLLQVGKNYLYRYIADEKGGRLVRLKDERQAEGGFMTGSQPSEWTERIDFTQHCISAYAATLVDVRGGTL